MHMRATQHFHHGLLLLTPKEKKQNYLHRKAPNKQNKNEKSFGFSFNYYYNMKSKLAKSYNYFFVFLRFFKHTSRKHKKENKLAWIVQ